MANSGRMGHGAGLAAAPAFSLAVFGRGRPTPLKLTLAGVITGSLLGALTEAAVFLNATVAKDY
jgi:ABC-type Fe3+-siderophore transport system permease subunit